MIATKGGLERPGPGRWTPNGRPEYLVSACEGSLRRLRLEQIPLYQFHRPDPAGAARGLGRRPRRAEGRGQDPPHRAVQRHRGAAPARPAAHADRVDPEPLQPHRPWLGVARRPVRTGADRLPPVGPDPGSRRRRRSWARSPPGTTPRDRQVALAWLLARSPAMLVIPGTASRSAPRGQRRRRRSAARAPTRSPRSTAVGG